MKNKILKILLVLLIIGSLMFAYVLNGNNEAETATSKTSQTPQGTNTETAGANTTSQIIENNMTERQQELYDSMNTTEMLDFTLPDFYGKEQTLSNYKGEILVLNFWAIGCPPCVNELPDFDEVCSKEGVRLITVAQKNILGNEKEKSFEFIKQFNSTNLWDETGETMSIYPSQYYPHTYIIDRQGVVRFAINSATYELLDELVTFCDEFFD